MISEYVGLPGTKNPEIKVDTPRRWRSLFNRFQQQKIMLQRRYTPEIPDTVLSLINAPGALQFFKRGMFIRGKFSMQKCSV